MIIINSACSEINMRRKNVNHKNAFNSSRSIKMNQLKILFMCFINDFNFETLF